MITMAQYRKAARKAYEASQALAEIFDDVDYFGRETLGKALVGIESQHLYDRLRKAACKECDERSYNRRTGEYCEHSKVPSFDVNTGKFSYES